MNDRIDYLIECSRTAREELLFRIKHRDNWLKIQLFAQIILWGLANKIQIGNFASNESIPYVLILSLPVSFVFVVLYCIEDRLIYFLSSYISSLTKKENEISKNKTVIYCWDASFQLQNYSKGFSLFLRIISQIFGFLLLPICLLITYYIYINNDINCCLIIIQIIFALFISIFIFILIIMGYRQRYNTGKVVNNK